MTIRNASFTAVIMLVSALSGARAAAPADIAAALAPEIVQVVSGGSWENDGKKGGYRAVLVAPSGEAGAGAQLFVEWLAAGKDGAPPALVMATPIKEINDLKLADASLSMEFEKANEFTVFVEPNDPGKVSGNSYTILASGPGKYNFTLGAPPE